MEDDVKFLLERMDRLETRLLSEMRLFSRELDQLKEFKQRLLGMAMVAGGVASIIIETVMRKLS